MFRSKWLVLVLGAVALCLLFLLGLAESAGAASQVTLIRTYNSDTRGQVFEVCRGRFDPPAGEAQNPAYCHGRLGYWSLERWQRYNAGGSGSGAGGATGTGKKGTRKPGPAVAKGGEPALESQATPAPLPPDGGSLDPTVVLGVQNPLCGEPGKLSARQVRNCRSSHSPEAAYPVGNYGWDIHVEAGGFISSLFAPAVSFTLQLLSVIWLVLLMMLKGCLIVLGFAFSLSPFTDNRILSEVGSGLTRTFEHLTSPWLSTLFLILGGWGLYNGLIRRRAGETLGGIGVALVMMLAGMWIIHSPRETVGRVAATVNSASMAAVAAPTSGHLGAPTRSYNEAMEAVWTQMTAVPFCAMDFSDVQWCMKAKPSPEAIEAARKGLGEGDAYAQQLLSGLPGGGGTPTLATKALSRDLGGLFGPAPTVRDLYLRFSPLGGPREALWKYYNGEPDEHIGLPLDIGPQLNIGGGSKGAAPDKVAMQGRNGVLTRMVMVLVFTLGLLGGLLLLLWIAMRLVMATASAFVLVLATPLAMFFPVFGQAGRAAFAKWATALLGAIVAKLIFSGLLGIVLLGSTAIGSSVGHSSPTLGLIATMAFWWAVFLQRERYLALLQVGRSEDRGVGIYRMVAGGYLGYRVAKAAKGAVTSFRAERSEHLHRRRDQEATSRRREADRSLDAQAHQRLDVETTEAEARLSSRSKSESEASALREDSEVRRLHTDSESLGGEARTAAETKARRLAQLRTELAAGEPQAQLDRRLINRVRANEEAGLPRYGKAELQGAREAIRREASLPTDSREHAWRARAAGKDPGSPEGRRAIAESLATTHEAAGKLSAERLEQVDLRRPAAPGSGGQRRPESGLRKKQPPRSSSSEAQRDDEAPLPRPQRRSRMRDWLSR